MQQSPRSTAPALRPLVITTFTLYFGWGLASPVLPLHARGLGAGTALAGLIVASFSVAAFCFDIAGGRFSDRYGVRRAATGGVLIVAFASMIAAVAPNPAVLLGSRLITGAGQAVYVTTAMNILARTTAPERMGRTMSAYQGSILLGVSFGPSAGGLVAATWGLRLPFLLGGLMSLVAAGVAAATLPSRLPARAGAGMGGRSELRPVLRDGAFLTALAIAAVVFILRAGVNSTAVPLYANDVLGLSKGAIGLALTVAALSNFLFLPHAGRLADRQPRRVSVLVGLVATLVALAMLGLWQERTGLYLAMVVMGMATAYAGVTPAAIITDVTPPAVSGTALGVYRMGVDAGSIIGPLAAGTLMSAGGHGPAFLWLALPAALLLPAAFRLRETRAGVRIAAPEAPANAHPRAGGGDIPREAAAPGYGEQVQPGR